jgi:hypothetical protein
MQNQMKIFELILPALADSPEIRQACRNLAP